jgi:hypothetical protein
MNCQNTTQSARSPYDKSHGGLNLRQMQAAGKADGGDILCQYLQTSIELACVSKDVAYSMLRMPGNREVSWCERDSRRGR